MSVAGYSFLEGAVTPLLLSLVSVLWGCTNPLIKIHSSGIENINETNSVRQFIAETKFLVFNLKYLSAFIVNQLGSVLYFICLSSADLSMAAPITSALTFVFTHCCGVYLGEPTGRVKQTSLGILCVVIGVFLCVADKSLQSVS